MYVGLTRARRHLSLSWAASRNPGGRGTRRPSRFLDAAARELGHSVSTRPGARRPQARTVARARCRTCGGDLRTAAERKVGRCADCPATYDEGTFEALKTWRLAVAKRRQQPAFVVFTDATLVAIAEVTPSTAAELTRIPGIGAAKLSTYGESVLAVLHGASPEDEAESCCAAIEST